MATPEFNSTGVNGLTTLKFENSGMSSKLSATGNTVRVRVGTVQVRTVDAAPPGVDWTIKRALGVAPRQVIWDVRLKAASDANLNTVESAIEAYLADGRAYALTDGKGRSTTQAVLMPQGTERIGFRERVSGGAVVQVWRLTFHVLIPRTGATQL